MDKQPIIRDERYTAVENASFRIGYSILVFGLFVVIVIRALLFDQSNWDLFALIVISSLAATLYQSKHKIISFSWKWILYIIATAVLAALVVFALTSLIR